MKEPFIFMSLLISDPKVSGNEIDVYLRLLIDDLKELWENGVQTYDSMSRSNFKLHASILWTINNFSAYGNLSGWSTKGYHVCRICNRDASSLHLKHRRKICSCIIDGFFLLIILGGPIITNILMVSPSGIRHQRS